MFIQRKRLIQNGSVGSHGLPKSDFWRLVITVLSILLFYIPRSFVVLGMMLSESHKPFSWVANHGPNWSHIVIVVQDKVYWESWSGFTVAVSLFILSGITRETKVCFRRCMKWIGKDIPGKLQGVLSSGMSTSQTSKEETPTNTFSTVDVEM